MAAKKCLREEIVKQPLVQQITLANTTQQKDIQVLKAKNTFFSLKANKSSFRIFSTPQARVLVAIRFRNQGPSSILLSEWVRVEAFNTSMLEDGRWKRKPKEKELVSMGYEISKDIHWTTVNA